VLAPSRAELPLIAQSDRARDRMPLPLTRAACECVVMGWPTRLLIAVGGIAASVAATERLYRRYLRRRVLNWGATEEEVARRSPGDELLESADIVATRVIGIDAPPSTIWPWLVQMGPGRAGAYTYDWIENLFGLNMHSADRIVPEWQQLEVGDVLRSAEGRPGMRVEILEPESALSNRSEASDWVWTLCFHRRTALPPDQP
jgi:hypothetical protein